MINKSLANPAAVYWQEKLSNYFAWLPVFATAVGLSTSVCWATPSYHVIESQTTPTNNITKSSALGGITSTPVSYRALVPSDYPNCPSSQPCYSIVYFLHGRGANSSMLESLGALEALEQLLRENPLMKLIVVSPDGGLNYWLNQPSPKPVRAEWASFVANAFIDEVQNQFPLAIRSADHRVLAGISMGGHGALQIALNFPNRFSCVAAHSPVLRTFAETAELRGMFGDETNYVRRDPLSLLIMRRQSQNPQLFFKQLWIDIGINDWALPRTSLFIDNLFEMYPRSLMEIDRSSKGGHDNIYWQKRLPDYLRWYNRCLSTNGQLRAFDFFER